MTSQMQRAVRFLRKENSVWGPIFLFSSGIIAAKASISIDLLVMGCVGFFLSHRLQVRGFCYSLIFLTIISITKHLVMFQDEHLWHLGVQSSLALAFFITALSSAQGTSWIQSLESQIETAKASFQNLEEELAKVHRDLSEQQIIFQERIGELRKELEELQIEHSSILILNEVLRKKSRAAQEEQETSANKYLAINAKLDLLQGEYDLIVRELARIEDSDGMASLNKQIMEELNDARFEKEQMHLTNETLNRLAYRESLKLKEVEAEIDSLKTQLRAAHEKIRTLEEPLEKEIRELSQHKETLSQEFEKAIARANELAHKESKLEHLETERNFLKERLDQALHDINILNEQDSKKYLELQKECQDLFKRELIAKEHVSELATRINELEKELESTTLREQVAKKHVQELGARVNELEEQNPQDGEMLKTAQDKIAHLSQIEPLYRQLKKQFDEKNKVLAETRKDLFNVDTMLQKLMMDKQALELSPLAREMEEEFQILGDQIAFLEEENKELQELVKSLSQASRQKKK